MRATGSSVAGSDVRSSTRCTLPTRSSTSDTTVRICCFTFSTLASLAASRPGGAPRGVMRLVPDSRWLPAVDVESPPPPSAPTDDVGSDSLKPRETRREPRRAATSVASDEPLPSSLATAEAAPPSSATVLTTVALADVVAAGGAPTPAPPDVAADASPSCDAAAARSSSLVMPRIKCSCSTTARESVCTCARPSSSATFAAAFSSSVASGLRKVRQARMRSFSCAHSASTVCVSAASSRRTFVPLPSLSAPAPSAATRSDTVSDTADRIVDSFARNSA
mmetsp:Transcript_1629/g.5228  ORF Transcript_1629/g.5228 Transcript_1629/m.5228 type:complete len:279 (+) Transcript_1629:818-1654(+)